MNVLIAIIFSIGLVYSMWFIGNFVMFIIYTVYDIFFKSKKKEIEFKYLICNECPTRDTCYFRHMNKDDDICKYHRLVKKD